VESSEQKKRATRKKKRVTLFQKFKFMWRQYLIIIVMLIIFGYTSFIRGAENSNNLLSTSEGILSQLYNTDDKTGLDVIFAAGNHFPFSSTFNKGQHFNPELQWQQSKYMAGYASFVIGEYPSNKKKISAEQVDVQISSGSILILNNINLGIRFFYPVFRKFRVSAGAFFGFYQLNHTELQFGKTFGGGIEASIWLNLISGIDLGFRSSLSLISMERVYKDNQEYKLQDSLSTSDIKAQIAIKYRVYSLPIDNSRKEETTKKKSVDIDKAKGKKK